MRQTVERQENLFEFEHPKGAARTPLSPGMEAPPPLSEEAKSFIAGAPLDHFDGLRLPKVKRRRATTSRERCCQEHLGLISLGESEQETVRALLFPLEAEYGLSRPLVEVLAHRLFQLSGGTPSREFIFSFLNPAPSQIPHWSKLGGCRESAEALISLLRAEGLPFLAGDYDVDGITSLAQAILVLRAIGIEPAWGIPHRLNEGYGRLERIIEAARGRGASAVVTMDFGSGNAPDFALARRFGMLSFVIDHHFLSSGFRRPSDYYINPALCGYGDNLMAASGLTNRFLHALIDIIEAEGPAEWRHRLADFDRSIIDSLAALGTIADVMPLLGANRALVKFGLESLSKSPLPGMRAMFDLAEISLPLDSQTAAFRIAPPLNAAGRLDDASLALQLLIETNKDDAIFLATRIEGLNAKRREIETEMVRRAERLLGRRPESEPALIVYHRSFHKGVNGIACSRLVDRYHKVGMVGTQLKGGDVEASLRSNGQVNLASIMEAVRPFAKKAGGHAMAGGVTVESRNLKAFKDAFFAACEEQGQTPKVDWNASADMEAPLSLLPKLMPQLGRLRELLGPFGCANEEPAFLTRNIRVLRESLPDNKHWRGELSQRGCRAEARLWHDANHPALRSGGPLDLIYQVSSAQDSSVPKIDLVAAAQHVRNAPT